MSDNNDYKWVCTICEMSFPHDQEDKAIDHMWDCHVQGEPDRFYRWKDGDINELVEQEQDHAI